MDTWYSAANMTGDQQRYISRHLLYFTIRTHMYEISVHGRIASRVVDLLRHYNSADWAVIGVRT